MPQIINEEIIKLQPKGLLTIPKKLRQDLLEENSLVRVKKEKGRLVLEPVRTLSYPVRRYTDKEVRKFLEVDKLESRALKKKGLL